MSAADVTREGQDGVRPGREARLWGGGGGKRRDRPAADHPGDSYYGQPILNAPVWEELDIAGYLFTGGLAGGSSLLAAGADLTGRPVLARRARLCATGAIGVSFVGLIHDLGRPERFVNMLRTFKPTSPMSVGTWILSAYAPLNGAASASSVLGRAPRTGSAAGVGAGLLGTLVASYTAALFSNTAVPAWHEGHRELPFVFVGSAAGAAAGFGLMAAPRLENDPARRLALLGTAVELAAEQLMERRMGMVAEAFHVGKAGERMRAARALSAAGALGAAAFGHRSRGAAAVSGAALLAGSALTRFGVFAAGMTSADDPRYVVEPQRERLRQRRAA